MKMLSQIACKSTVAEDDTQHHSHHYSTERNDRVSPLLRLPGELKNHIYEYVLTVSYPLCFSRKKHATKKTKKSRDKKLLRVIQFDISLLHVCRKIHHDTALLPFSLNTIQCDSLMVVQRLQTHLSVEQRQAVRVFRMKANLQHRDKLKRHLSGEAPKVESLSTSLPALRHVELELESRPEPPSRYWPFYNRMTEVDRNRCNDVTRAFMDLLGRWVRAENDAELHITWEGKWFWSA